VGGGKPENEIGYNMVKQRRKIRRPWSPQESGKATPLRVPAGWADVRDPLPINRRVSQYRGNGAGQLQGSRESKLDSPLLLSNKGGREELFDELDLEAGLSY